MYISQFISLNDIFLFPYQIRQGKKVSNIESKKGFILIVPNSKIAHKTEYQVKIVFE